MRAHSVQPTGREQFFNDDEIIVGKTDPNGEIHYVNDVFIRISGFSEVELLGAPHSIIRHPDMPRGVFKLLWDTVQQGREIFAYVKNMCRSGDHYWVYAHVTPTFGARGEIVGYHSNRRTANREALSKVIPIYERMLIEERRHELKPEAARSSVQLLERILSETGMPYEEFVRSLENRSEVRC